MASQTMLAGVKFSITGTQNSHVADSADSADLPTVKGPQMVRSAELAHWPRGQGSRAECLGSSEATQVGRIGKRSQSAGV